jgi:hypothetical protein
VSAQGDSDMLETEGGDHHSTLCALTATGSACLQMALALEKSWVIDVLP